MSNARRLKLILFLAFIGGSIGVIVSLLTGEPRYQCRIDAAVVKKTDAPLTSEMLSLSDYALKLIEQSFHGDRFLKKMIIPTGKNGSNGQGSLISTESWREMADITINYDSKVIAVTLDSHNRENIELLSNQTISAINSLLSDLLGKEGFSAEAINGPTIEKTADWTHVFAGALVGSAFGLLLAVILLVLRKDRADFFLYSKAGKNHGMMGSAENIPLRREIELSHHKNHEEDNKANSKQSDEEQAIKERLNRLINGE